MTASTKNTAPTTGYSAPAYTWAEKWFRVPPQGLPKFLHEYTLLTNFSPVVHVIGGSDDTFRQALLLLTPRKIVHDNRVEFDATGICEWSDGSLAILKSENEEVTESVPPHRNREEWIREMEIWARANINRLEPYLYSNNNSLVPFSRFWSAAARLEQAAYSLVGLKPGTDFPDRHAMRAIKAFTGVHGRHATMVLAGMHKKFCQRLDAETITTVRRAGFYTTKLYNWLHAEGDAKKARNRRQAVLSCRILAGALGHEVNDLKAYEQQEEYERLIDAGKPVNDHMLKWFSLTQAKLARLRTYAWQRVGRNAINYPSVFIETLNWLEENYIPHNRKDWSAFNSISVSLQRLSQFIGTKKVLAPFKDGWQKGVESLSRRYQNLPQQLHSAGDTISALREVIESRMRANETAQSTHQLAPPELIAEAISPMSLREFMNASKRWHDAQLRITREMLEQELAIDKNGESMNEWQPLLPEPYSRGDVHIVEIVTGKDLMEEGIAMQNCVGGFESNCRYYGSRIFSVRDKHGNRISTLEFHVNEQEITLGQHEGFYHAKPPKHAARAANALLADIRTGKAAHNTQAVIKATRAAKEEQNLWNEAKHIAREKFNQRKAEILAGIFPRLGGLLEKISASRKAA